MDRRHFLTASLTLLATPLAHTCPATPTTFSTRKGVLVHACVVPGQQASLPTLTQLRLTLLGNDMGHYTMSAQTHGGTAWRIKSPVVGTLLERGEPLSARIAASMPDDQIRIEVTLDRPLKADDRLPLHDLRGGGVDAQLLMSHADRQWHRLTALPGCSYLPMRTGPVESANHPPSPGNPVPAGLRLRKGLLRHPNRLLAQFRPKPCQDLTPAAVALWNADRIAGFLHPVWDHDLEQLLLRGEQLEARIIGQGGNDYPGGVALEVVLVG